MNILKWSLLFGIFGFTSIIGAQVPVTSELYKTFEKTDSLMFEVGFNNCNLQPLEDLLTEDLEFYHDVAGIQNKNEFMTAMRANICGAPERKPIRKLTPNTMKVYPLYNNGVLYGAIVEGKHDFFIKEPNKALYQTGSALFSGLWIKVEEEWKVKRIYSYHHGAK